MQNTFFKYIQLKWKHLQSYMKCSSRESASLTRHQITGLCSFQTKTDLERSCISSIGTEMAWHEFPRVPVVYVLLHSPSFSSTCMLAFLFLSPGSLSVFAVTVCTSSSELSSSDNDDDDDDDDSSSSLLSDSSSSTRATSCRANTSSYYRRNEILLYIDT